MVNHSPQNPHSQPSPSLARLDSLPVELKRLILLHLTSLSALYSLIDASPAYRAVFVEDNRKDKEYCFR